MNKMPEPVNPHPVTVKFGNSCYLDKPLHDAFDAGAAAQRELLEGYVKLPGVEELTDKLRELGLWLHPPGRDVDKWNGECLHQWLQEERWHLDKSR